jgi:translation initiation factor 3 subunit B
MESARMELQALEEEMLDLSPYLSDEEEGDGEVDEDQVRVTSTLVVVDNCPKIPGAKFEKLKKVLTKIYGQFGKIEDMELPVDPETKKTSGFALIEFSTEAQARKAVKNTNGWKLDKKHIFAVNHFSDVEKFLAMDENFDEPKASEYAPLAKLASRSEENLRAWLADEYFRDQFVVRHESETQISWCEPMGAPTPCYSGERQKAEGKNWCEMYVAWSTSGTYLATFHHQGIVLWGGSAFKKLLRYDAHPFWHLAFPDRWQHSASRSPKHAASARENMCAPATVCRGADPATP